MAGLTEANKLTSASARGDLSEVETLLQSGADVNKANRFGRTALQVMKLGVPGLAEMLLEAKADPNKRDPVKDLTVAHDAARDGYLETLQVLVKYGADVNALDSDGNLPLHLAAQAGNLDVVEFLKQCTEEPSRANLQGSTADDLLPTHSKECIQGRMQSQN